MLELLRSKRLGFWVACAFGLLGICLGCRRLVDADATANLTRGQLQVAYLDSILAVFGAGIVGLLAGFGLTVVQRAMESLDRADEGRIREAERWDRLFQNLKEFMTLTQAASINREAATGRDPARQEAIVSIRQTIRSRNWREADRLVEALKANEHPEPELDQLSLQIEHGRREDVESQLERIKASKEVGDSERVLELYQDAAPILEPERRKSLEDDLARWFMSQIQRRLRSGTIQAEVVTLTARVSEIFSGTTEGASLRAGLPTLRRTVGLCPRCGGPYTGVSEACPDCLGIAAP